jgi:hypothetical protein
MGKKGFGSCKHVELHEAHIKEWRNLEGINDQIAY